MGNTIKDIKTFVPINTSQEFCLDTNVLYWYTYPRYTFETGHGTQLRTQPYYDFVDILVSNGNPLITTRYNISELINIIEKHEFKIFCATNTDAEYSIKDWRRMPEQRKSLKRILKTTIENVKAICQILDFNFSELTLDACINSLDCHRCDVFDYAIISFYQETNHLNIITDDDDFTSIDGLRLFTSNERSLLRK